MQSEESKEIETLLQKIEQHKLTIAKMRSEQQKLSAHIAQFKTAIERSETAEKRIENENEIGKTAVQLKKEIENANSVLRNCRNELRTVERKAQSVSAEDLELLEDTVRQKETLLKRLKEEMKALQAQKRKEEKSIAKQSKAEDNGSVSRLVEEIRRSRQILSDLKQRQQKQSEGVRKKKEKLRETEQKYFAECTERGENAVTFEQFKEKVRRKKEQSEIEVEKQSKAKNSAATVREIVESHPNIEGVEVSEKGMEVLQSKKEIAETALRNAYRKHEKEIDELTKKLSFLHRENSDLLARLAEKLKQRETIESSFSDISRTLPMMPVRTARKLTPLK